MKMAVPRPSELEAQYSDRPITVVIPEIVEPHWYHYLLHNQRARWLKALLLQKGSQRVSVVSVPWHLKG